MNKKKVKLKIGTTKIRPYLKNYSGIIFILVYNRILNIKIFISNGFKMQFQLPWITRNLKFLLIKIISSANRKTVKPYKFQLRLTTKFNNI